MVVSGMPGCVRLTPLEWLFNPEDGCDIMNTNIHYSKILYQRWRGPWDLSPERAASFAQPMGANTQSLRAGSGGTPDGLLASPAFSDTRLRL